MASLVGIFAFAFAARLVPVLRGGGIHFYGRYDDGVYYTASEALSFGHLPYRDFVLLHPPGSNLALMPFVLLGRLTSDPFGMTVARLSFMALGGLSAVLVAVIAGRWGRLQGVLAGLLYGASAAAVYSEQATFLEPLGTFLVLVALVVLVNDEAKRSRWLELLAGVTLGLACSVKIWYVAIFGAIFLTLLFRREFRTAIRVAAAGATAAAVVILPFFILAPNQMWTMVVRDQFGRNGSAKPRLERISSIVGTKNVLDGVSPTAVHLVTAIIVICVLLAATACWFDERSRMIAVTFGVCALVLFASPSYFRHYGVLLAAPTALVLAIGLGKLVGLVDRPSFRTPSFAVAGALVALSGIAVALQPTGERFPSERFIEAAPLGCIASDDPAALIQMNRLTENFKSGCSVPVDVTGASYGADLPRAQNEAFRAWLVKHLTTSDAFVILRMRNDKLSEEEKAFIRTHPVLASGFGLNLRRGDGA